MKVSEASSAALDWMVAKCEGLEPHIEPTFDGTVILIGSHSPTDYFPSTDWAQAGPIIEREGICTAKITKTYWLASPDMESPNDVSGPTLLIAAMRCYVASKLGDEVEVPEELC